MVRLAYRFLMGLAALALVVPAQVLGAQPNGGEDRHDWRAARCPRIEVAPDPSRIQVLPDADGLRAQVIGHAGAAGDRRASIVRIVNLATADEVATRVRSDGSFQARLVAPAGSTLQISTLSMEDDALPPELREALLNNGSMTPADLPEAELYVGMIGSHPSCSPATILSVLPPSGSDTRWPAFVRKVGAEHWLVGHAEPSDERLDPGEPLDIEINFASVHEAAQSSEFSDRSPQVGFALHRLFDQRGRQRSFGRQPTSDVLTPTGLPIETHGEMVAEPRPDGGSQWNLGGTGIPVPQMLVTKGQWRSRAVGRVEIAQRWRIEIPAGIPAGRYGVTAMVWGVGDPEFGGGEPAGGPWCLGYVTIGDPAPPRLTCLLLGSAGTAGTRGTVAREDRSEFSINTKIAFTPERLIIPRDDAYTHRPINYPLDPYVPMLSMANRPPPVIPKPLIPLDVRDSRLLVTVTSPNGTRDTLGPAPLLSLQNDLSVLRPDYVLRDRVMAPVGPTYGNPSAADMLHLTGRGTFDYAFDQYGHYIVELTGHVSDAGGTAYQIGGAYDVYVAKPLNIETFPEPGTPLQPNIDICPQVRVLPPCAATVEMRWRHYPHSDPARVVQRTISGRANRWGIFVTGAEEPPLKFADPGEYVCDVTVEYEDGDGTLWMASRRNASVVVTPGSQVVVHGERGNRSPTARWRARWFMAGDGQFIAPPAKPPPERQEDIPRQMRLHRVELGHTCLPYEPGDVAWLGHRMNFSLFPGITFEDPEGTISALIEERWPAVRLGAGREGLYPYALKPEDRWAIGEMPYVCMTASGLPPSLVPEDIDRWGYFYSTSWRPGVAVRALVSEDAQPVGYWFFDDPYAHQFGNGPHGDLAGDVKMNYGGGVFRDKTSGVTHYGGYASMLVLIDGDDPLGARVLPPFDGLLPGSPRCGPLLQIGGRRYDAFLTLGALAPGAVLEVGDRLNLSGSIWPPIEGSVEVNIVAPSGERLAYAAASDPLGTFSGAGPTADEPGVWTISAEAICSGKTSVGTIRQHVAPAQWPRGGVVGLPDRTFEIPVTRPDAPRIAFDIPPGSRASPPQPLVIRGQLPPGTTSDQVHFVVTMPGQVIQHGTLPVQDHAFEYAYEPESLRRRFPNLDTRIEMPAAGYENQPAWFDTVTCTFWAGQDTSLTAGMVLLQGEQLYALSSTGEQLPLVPADDLLLSRRDSMAGELNRSANIQPTPATGGNQERATTSRHSSLLSLSADGHTLFAVHPWSGEIARINVRDLHAEIDAAIQTGGQPSCVVLSADETTVFVTLADRGEVLVLRAETLELARRLMIGGEPRACVPSPDGKRLYVADFLGDCVWSVDLSAGQVEHVSPRIDRPACLAISPAGDEVYTVSFRTGETTVLDPRCHVVRTLSVPAQLNQCRTLTFSPDGLLFAPQTRSDTVVGGRMFDRSVFPAIVVADPDGEASIRYWPDLLVVPPHRPAEVAVSDETIFLASAGSDDVLAIDRGTGFATWHQQRVGLEPAAIVLDPVRQRLYVLTITGQEIVTLGAFTGTELYRLEFTHDPTPAAIARGRYLFGTATDKRLTKDQWMSCAVCHPDGEQDGRPWDLGEGPLDTRSLRGCLATAPLHYDGHLDEIQDTLEFTRHTMAGQWFVPPDTVHSELSASHAGRDSDLDALAAYIATLTPSPPPQVPDALQARFAQGKEIFLSQETGCVVCHPPPFFTDSGRRVENDRYVLHDVGTRVNADGGPQPLDTPSLLGLLRSAPYLHDGRAKTIEEIFSKWNPSDKHGRTSHLTDDEIKSLAVYLRYLNVAPQR